MINMRVTNKKKTRFILEVHKKGLEIVKPGKRYLIPYDILSILVH